MQETTGKPPAVGELAIVVGELAMHEGRGIGRVMAVGQTRVTLRPQGGGLEWDAPAERVRAASQREVLAATMRARGLLRTETGR